MMVSGPVRQALGAVLLSALALSAPAATYLWDVIPGEVGAGNGAVDDGSGEWNLANGNWTADGGAVNVAWVNSTTNLAVFSGMAGGAVGVNGNLSAGGLVFSGAGTNGYVFTGSAAPSLTLGTGGLTLSPAGGTIFSNVLSGASACLVNGGGALTLAGANTFTGEIKIGNASSGNVVRVTGRLTGGTSGYSFNVGRNGFGNNTVELSGPGNVNAPTVWISGNSSSFWVGGENAPSSGNRLILRNGACLRAAAGNGTTDCKVGQHADSCDNSITVTGSNSTTGYKSSLVNAGHWLIIGGAGSGNRLQVSAGGQVSVRVFGVGQGGGDNNTASVTGDGSYLGVTEDIYLGAGTNNRITVAEGARLYSQTRSGRVELSCTIGLANGSNGNSLTVTGAGTTWTNNGYPVAIGGAGGQAATNNALNLSGGATATINTGVRLNGVNSTFNLGDGNGVSSATVGSTRDGAVQLNVPDARLNMNGGRLVAGADGALVSGPGQVALAGPAYVSTAQPGSTIGSAIGGAGSLVKEGPGTLALTATNTFAGDLIVSNGVLRLTHERCLSEGTTVRISSGAVVDLAFSGVNTIAALYVDGMLQYRGVYGHNSHPDSLLNTGYLRTTTGGIPDGVLLIVR